MTSKELIRDNRTAGRYRERPFRELILRICRFHRTYGIITTIRRACTLLLRLDPYKRMVAQASKKGNEAVFSEIYDRNLWSTAESYSGRGSTVDYTANLREALPLVLRKLDVRIFIDAPCGDYNWMRLVPFPTECRYIGLDVVPKLIESNQKSYGGGKAEFHKLDITREPLPHGDLLFCRDCLFHLSVGDIFKFLENFVRSETKYLMTSTHRNLDGFPNRDINSGDFRLLDLFAEPFGFTSSVIYRVDDFVSPDPAREMCVWPRTAIDESLIRYRGFNLP